ncbi:hypothetical protein WJN01_01195 [Flavobacteriaceae bacterium SZ-1-7]|uniref:hypothetical protein n=1 Tax=Tamlana sedimenti TaxID=3134126 RepID=UPI0031294FAC
MKKIIYITFSILTIGLFSCSEDDSYSIAYVDNEQKVALTGTLTITNPSTTIYTGDAISFIVEVPQAFEVDAKVEVTFKSSYNELALTSNIDKVYVTIPKGTTSLSGTYDASSFGNDIPFLGVADFLTANITGIALVQPPKEDEEGNPINPYVPVDDPYTMTSEAVNFQFIAGTSWTVPTDKTLMVSLDWQGPYSENDIDLYIIDSGFTTLYESSESGSRFEGDFFNNPANENHPDGDYVVEIGVYTSVDDSPIPYQLTFTHPDGTREVFEGTVDPTIGYVDPVGFTKTTDGEGNVTYDIYAL